MRYVEQYNISAFDEPTQRYSVALATEEELLTLAEAKAQLIVDAGFTGDDDLISAYITAARQNAEQFCGMSFVHTTVTERLNYWPIRFQDLVLSWGNVASVTSIQYVDVNGDTQTWEASKYKVDTTSSRARIRPAFNETFPDIRDELGAITITYVSGFGATADDVPEAIKQAVRLMLTSFYENRVDSVFKMPTASQYLLNPYNCRLT